MSSDERELLGLRRMIRERVVERRGGEEVLTVNLTVTVLGNDIHAAQVGVFDAAESPPVAVPALGAVMAPRVAGVGILAKPDRIRRQAAVDGAAFEQDGASPHTARGGVDAEPDSWNQLASGVGADEHVWDPDVLVLWEFADVREHWNRWWAWY